MNLYTIEEDPLNPTFIACHEFSNFNPKIVVKLNEYQLFLYDTMTNTANVLDIREFYPSLNLIFFHDNRSLGVGTPLILMKEVKFNMTFEGPIL